jgi:hypothetical protein
MRTGQSGEPEISDCPGRAVRPKIRWAGSIDVIEFPTQFLAFLPSQ